LSHRREEGKTKTWLCSVQNFERTGSYEDVYTGIQRGNSEDKAIHSSEKSCAKFARTDQREFSFTVRTMDKWNRLPDIVKQAAT